MIFVFSMISYVIGDNCNAWVLARVRWLTGGKHLWLRCIGSTVVAHIVGGIIFVPVVWLSSSGMTGVAMLGLYAADFALKLILTILVFPAEMVLINYLKKMGAEEPEDFIPALRSKESGINLRLAHPN